MQVTGTHIAYLFLCHRKLWLFSNGVNMEHTSETVADGKLLSETTYLDRTRRYTELELDGIKLDFYDIKANVIHEVKKSDSVEMAHIAQVQYYMYVLQKHRIECHQAILEYPRLKHREIVLWSDDLWKMAPGWEKAVVSIVKSVVCPPVISAKICKSCSYFELCYIGE